MTSAGLKVEMPSTLSPIATKTLLASAMTKVGEAAGSPPLTASLVLLTLLCAELKPINVALRTMAFSSGAVVRAIQSLLDWTRASAPDAKQGYGALTSPTEVSSKADKNPFDVSLIGDYSPWTDGLGPMFHSLGGWDYTWAMPQEPTNQHPGSWHAYWAPPASPAPWPPGLGGSCTRIGKMDPLRLAETYARTTIATPTLGRGRFDVFLPSADGLDPRGGS